MASRLFAKLACLLLVAFGLVLLLFGLAIHVNALSARQMIAGDRSVEGVVTSTHSSRGGRHFSYEYSVGADRFKKDRTSIRGHDYDRLRAGSAIRVWYDPSRPDKGITREELAEIEFLPNRLVFPIIGALCVAWGLWALFGRRSHAA